MSEQAQAEELHLSCSKCGSATYRVVLTDYKKVSRTQPFKLPHHIPEGATAPTKLSLICSKCGHPDLDFPINQQWVLAE